MAYERRLLRTLARAERWFTIQRWGATEAGELCLDFQLEMPNGTFDGVLVYPDFFPDVPAYIRPQRFGESWSSHQYRGSGVLCLERGPDNWDPSVTGEEMIRSANRLLWSEILRAVVHEAPAISSRHTLTHGQELRGEPWRFILTPGLFHALADLEYTKPVEFRAVLTYSAGTLVALVTALGTPAVPVADVPQTMAEESVERSGWAVRVDSLTALGKVTDAVGLKLAMGKTWPWSDELSSNVQLLVLHDAGGGIRAFSVNGGVDPVFREYRVVDFTKAFPPRLPPEFSKLSEMTVAIVGLGSLGSKVAISLARTGVRRFVLVDDDVLAPQNLVRNELSWLDVGYAKVDVVARKLKLIAPGVEVKTNDVQVAGQENPLIAANLGADLGACDLLIDATANPNAFVTLAALCKRAKTTLVWGEVFAGGAGALMARSRPQVDADPLSVRSHVQGVMGTLSPVPFAEKADRYGHEVEGRIYVASDADVSALAALMTQFALDALCCGSESAYPVAAYLIGFRKYWEFRQPFDTIPIDCSGALTPITPPEQLTPQDEADLNELIIAMEASRGATNNSAS